MVSTHHVNRHWRAHVYAELIKAAFGLSSQGPLKSGKGPIAVVVTVVSAVSVVTVVSSSDCSVCGVRGVCGDCGDCGV